VLIVIGFSTSHLATRPSHNLPLVAWSTLPIYFGSIVYAWECIGVIMAFRKSMGPNHKAFLPAFDVMMFISGVTFLALGEIAYLAYGDISSPSVLVFLADNVRGPMFPMINLLLAFATVLGFPLQLNPAVGIFRDKLKWSETDVWHMVGLRLGLVGICYLSAMLVPHFALVVSLVGTTVGAALSMIFPVLLDLRIRVPEDRTARMAQYGLAAISTIVGTVGGVTGTRVVLEQIADIFWQAPPHD